MKFGSFPRSVFAVLVMLGLGAACSSNSGTTPSASGGTQSASGGTAQGGSAAGGKAASGGTAGASSASGGSSGSGGTISAGGTTGAGGASHTGGVSPSGGATGAGGAAGASAGGASGPANGGVTASGGASGIGSGGSQAPALDGGGALTAAVPSAGCGTQGKATLIAGGQTVPSGLTTSVQLTINSANGGGQRQYVIDIPADYDATHPYRLIFSWHQAYGSAVDNATGVYPAFNGPNFNATDYAFYGLHREMTAANDSAIFVAPEGVGSFPWDFARDSALFDDMLTLFETDLCIDQSRVFSTGFSFGAMMSYALSITRQTKLRAVVSMEGANYNLPNEPTDSNAAPIAFMGTTGMSDGTCPWVNGTSTTQGGKYCDLTHATDNGCDTSAAIPTTTVGSKSYLCYDFSGCKAGYPVKVCTFDGAHTPASVDDGSNTGDDGLKAFVPPIAWKFIAQF